MLKSWEARHDGKTITEATPRTPAPNSQNQATRIWIVTLTAYQATTGFVIVWRNRATDWIGSLEHPNMERPGVFAVSCSGRIFRAGDGWEPVDGGPEWSGDELPLLRKVRKDNLWASLSLKPRNYFMGSSNKLLSKGYGLDTFFDNCQ